jgi:DNA-binding PadR family transcriptional regulator
MYSKELLKGTLDAFIVHLLREQGKMYGYEIAMKVKELSQGKILLKDGSLYPALHKMTHDGLLAFEEVNIGKRVRKYYYLTTEGKKKSVDLLAELRDFLTTIENVLFKDFNQSFSS